MYNFLCVIFQKVVPCYIALSILWILALSFEMVTMVARTGCIIGVDEVVMGLVIVAIGTSVPVSDEAPILPFVCDIHWAKDIFALRLCFFSLNSLDSHSWYVKIIVSQKHASYQEANRMFQTALLVILTGHGGLSIINHKCKFVLRSPECSIKEHPSLWVFLAPKSRFSL